MSVLAAAALLCSPVSLARAHMRAQSADQKLQDVDRVTVTPTDDVGDRTPTSTPNQSGATSTATDSPTLQPIATLLVATPVVVTGTPVVRGTAIATATPGGSTSPTVLAPSPTVSSTPIVVGSPAATPMPPAPTPTIIPFNSDLTRVTIQAGSDPTRTVNLGEQLVFTIELKTQASLSEGLVITANIPDGTEYVPDSSIPIQVMMPVTPTASDMVSATEQSPPVEPAKRTLSWQVQPMSAGHSYIARYAVRVKQVTDSIVASASAVNVQTGETSTSNIIVLPTQPTAITFIHFYAEPHPLGIKIVWETGQELNTTGFVIWRNTRADRPSAMLITNQLIAAQDKGIGASYEYVDSGVAANQHYYYWLQEITQDRQVNDYGPLSAVAVNQSPQIVIAGSIGAGGMPLPVQVAGVDPNVVQTAQAALQRNNASTGELPNGVSQVSAQPIASPQVIVPAPVAVTPQATLVVVPEPSRAATASVAATPVAPAPLATQAPTAVVNSSVGAAPAIATIGVQPITSSAASVNPAATLPTTSTILETTRVESKTEAAPQSAAGAALPAAPANAQVVVPKVNVAAPPASEDSRTESRWSPFNWLLTGLLACFGWLIVSSFLAVAVGRYLKGRQ